MGAADGAAGDTRSGPESGTGKRTDRYKQRWEIDVVPDIWMVGACSTWVAAAVMDFGLRVQWAPALPEVPEEAEEADAGLLIFHDDVQVGVCIQHMQRLAGRWVVLQDTSGWRRARTQWAAESSVVGLQLIRQPGGPWTAKARRYNLRSRQALGEILEAVGMARHLVSLSG